MAHLSAAPIPIVALDFASASAALALVAHLADGCTFYKIGLELFVAEGPEIVRAVRARGAHVFLDLKLHDIPNTVAGAVRSAGRLGVRLLTVHTAGGPAMLAAAADAAAGSGCALLGVTVLTSSDTATVAAVTGRDVDSIDAEVMRLAALASDAALHGVVCSGWEAEQVVTRFGGRLAPLVPGIRPAGAGSDDQARVVTPAAAVRAGARYLVLGRPVTRAPEPRMALAAMVAEMTAAAAGSPLRVSAKPA